MTLHLSGLALHRDLDNRTFTIDIDVDISSYRIAKVGGNALLPRAPFLCILPEHGTLVLPDNNSIVSVVGSLADVTFVCGDRHQGVERFHLILERVVSLGQPSASCVDGKSNSSHFLFFLLMTA